LHLEADRQTLEVLRQAGVLDDTNHARALAEIGARPDQESWYRFARLHLVILGVVLLTAGVVFFVAANWEGLAGAIKLQLIGAVMTAATAMGAVLGLNSLSGRAAALLGGLLFGPLIATYGQAYQTGADNWLMFALWAAIMTGYAIVTRFVGAWIAWFALVHVAFVLMIDQLWGLAVWSLPVLLLVAFDVVVIAAAEHWSDEVTDLSPRALPRVALTVALAIGSIVTLNPEVVQSGLYVVPVTALVGTAVNLVVIALAVAGYRRRLPDLYMLTAAVFTFVLTSTWWLSRAFADIGVAGEPFTLFILAVALTAQAYCGARWLYRWHRQHRSEEVVR
jgi:uncharacterized membrane protein